MFKWIKSLFYSKRLKAAETRIKDLELKNLMLEEQISKLEKTFIFPMYDDEHAYLDEAEQLGQNTLAADRT